MHSQADQGNEVQEQIFFYCKENDTKEDKETSRHRFVHLNHLQ